MSFHKTSKMFVKKLKCFTPIEYSNAITQQATFQTNNAVSKNSNAYTVFNTFEGFLANVAEAK